VACAGALLAWGGGGEWGCNASSTGRAAAGGGGDMLSERGHRLRHSAQHVAADAHTRGMLNTTLAQHKAGGHCDKQEREHMCEHTRPTHTHTHATHAGGGVCCAWALGRPAAAAAPPPHSQRTRSRTLRCIDGAACFGGAGGGARCRVAPASLQQGACTVLAQKHTRTLTYESLPRGLTEQGAYTARAKG
jgi:hypothetical protein